MHQHNGIKRFSCQGMRNDMQATILMPFFKAMEKNNDDAKRNVMSSNYFDAPKEILVTDARLQQLDNNYWDRNGKRHKTDSS